MGKACESYNPSSHFTMLMNVDWPLMYTAFLHRGGGKSLAT